MHNTCNRALLVIITAVSINTFSIAEIKIPKPIPKASYAIRTETKPLSESIYTILGLPSKKESKTLTTTFYTFDGNYIQSIIEKDIISPGVRLCYWNSEEYLDKTAPKPRPLYFRLGRHYPTQRSSSFVLTVTFYDKNRNEIYFKLLEADSFVNLQESFKEKKIDIFSVIQDRQYIDENKLAANFKEAYALLSENQPSVFKKLDLSIVQKDTKYRTKDYKKFGFYSMQIGGLIILSSLIPVFLVLRGIEYIYDKTKNLFPATKSNP